ncbi:NAD-dependent protein deacetylase [Methylonatrum kenyense]|uniref:NAD-dependent protein deacetylase n=1 Tax=Methylonatrum kenyense TaxID=455253 RepID=UPI0020BD672B|nr:NAD-dependent protein deacetylase [Methylonatrum kenyense]MCK8516163.1 NAD-dependent protein deacetylase [Methylonatrum kenyense]
MARVHRGFSTLGLDPAEPQETVRPDVAALDALSDHLEQCRHVLVLSGAGCSTESGIPDYRATDGTWRGRRPIQFADFLRREAMRRRYWARSMVGWPVVAAAQPNPAHRALARLQCDGPVMRLVSQNVDGLHSRAGSSGVIDLHGRLDRVVCLDCAALGDRRLFQQRLQELNPGWQATGAAAPDGDADLADDAYQAFRVPDCERCGGLMKPDVVFFGENVPKPLVAEAFQSLDRADALLVVGSSLMVWSGYRFVRRAVQQGVPVYILGLGRTRGDDEAALRVRGSCGDLLSRLADRLTAGR